MGDWERVKRALRGIAEDNSVEMGGFGEPGRNREKAPGNFEHIFGFKGIRKIIGYCENLCGKLFFMKISDAQKIGVSA